MHWGIHFAPVEVAQYEPELGRAAIDAGADLVLGHHQHILKGIEVYRGKVIFHGLANFVMDVYMKALAGHPAVKEMQDSSPSTPSATARTTRPIPSTRRRADGHRPSDDRGRSIAAWIHPVLHQPFRSARAPVR